MTATNKLIAGIFTVLIILGIGAFIGVRTQVAPEKPTYSQSDSLELVRIDSVKGVYQQNIDKYDSIADKAIFELKQITKNNKSLRDRLNELLNNKTAPCEDKLRLSVFLNDSLTIECVKKDTVIEALDLECREYSNFNLTLKQENGLQIKRFNALSFKSDSIIVQRNDSITAIRKQHKKQMFWLKAKATIGMASAIAAGVLIAR